PLSAYCLGTTPFPTVTIAGLSCQVLPASSHLTLLCPTSIHGGSLCHGWYCSEVVTWSRFCSKSIPTIRGPGENADRDLDPTLRVIPPSGLPEV
ncbi:unnamed protein product, partial [Staurois parvus]